MCFPSLTGINVDFAVRNISRAQHVSLCFVVDTTGSMDAHINAVKEQITLIGDKVRSTGCRFAGIAFVGYKDWDDGEDHFEIFPFPETPGKTDIAAFTKFVSVRHNLLWYFSFCCVMNCSCTVYE